jgi:effector-binding domain-containing protein
MILHYGIRTTEPDLVVFRLLKPDENEAMVITKLLREIRAPRDNLNPRFDHSIVVYYDPPDAEYRRREVLIPVSDEVEGFPTRTLPSMKVAFLVFKGAEYPVELYYQRLQEYIDAENLHVSDKVYSYDVMYVPDDADNVDYTLEIMRPLVS